MSKTKTDMNEMIARVDGFLRWHLALEESPMPGLTGERVVTSLVIFIGLLAGALLWGVMGIIIVIPVLSIVMQLFKLSPMTEPFAYLIGPSSKQPGRKKGSERA